MNPWTHSALATRVTLLGLAVVWGGLSTAQAQAPIYRSVGADGRVSFSDRPSAGASVAGTGDSANAASPAPALPFALQQVVQRYPATLYTGPACGVCAQGRQLLQQRGIPFTEKTVSSADDLAAFSALQPERTLPLLSLGTQKLAGFDAAQWQQYLDAAGYPSTSILPASYRPPLPSPLSPSPLEPSRVRPSSPAPDDAAPRARAGETPNAPTGSNPAGIRF